MAYFGGEFFDKFSQQNYQKFLFKEQKLKTLLLHSVWPERFLRPLWNLAMRQLKQEIPEESVDNDGR